MAYLRKENIIKTEIIKSFTEKKSSCSAGNFANENPNSESDISSANNEKISKPKISTENEHHSANSSLLVKENNKDKEKKGEKGKLKLKNSVVKKTLILGDSIIKNVDGRRLNRKM